MSDRTTELREKLIERGVDWFDESNSYADVTTFIVNGTKWMVISKSYLNPEHDWMTLRAEHITPEQIITVTLGNGMCKNIAPGYLDFLCSKCGFVHYHSDENDSEDGNDWMFCPRCGARVE